MDIGLAAIFVLLAGTAYTLLTSLGESVNHDERCQRAVCCVGKDEDCH